MLDVSPFRDWNRLPLHATKEFARNGQTQRKVGTQGSGSTPCGAGVGPAATGLMAELPTAKGFNRLDRLDAPGLSYLRAAVTILRLGGPEMIKHGTRTIPSSGDKENQTSVVPAPAVRSITPPHQANETVLTEQEHGSRREDIAPPLEASTTV